MKFETRRFGEIVIKEDQTYHFERGIPGFEHDRQFMFVTTEELEPFAHMQSLEDGELAFIVTDPFVFFPNYEFNLPESVMNELQISSEEHVSIRVIVSINGELEQATANLIAPIIMNTNKRLGKQVILTAASYSTRQRLYKSEEIE
ncbi:flagellar assembly protein FliW [Paenibacillus rhizovicinus]|uniref:Flagellar assembly factor FliW n=1 Tax=Paenibacillus rhizovicinus TaxID=2704463 RepID=A0A6C0P270_9BACL|nr:flagellar assembly protein FliW [Paenibacillus rhizovicinus]QHW32594.1 flagellar assembly protein FliW [Paenibacillus rhizovicinus]